MLSTILYLSSLVLCLQGQFALGEDLLQNLNLVDAQAGRVEGVNIKTINIDLSALAKITQGGNVTNFMNVDGDQMTPDNKVVYSMGSEDFHAMNNNSALIRQKVAELVQAILSGSSGKATGVYQSGPRSSLVMGDKSMDTNGDIDGISQSDIEARVLELAKLSDPTFDPQEGNVNLVIVNCPAEGCSAEDLALLSSDNIGLTIQSQMTTALSGDAAPAQSAAASNPGGDYDDCNFLVVSLGGSSTAETVAQLQQNLANRNISCIRPNCPDVVTEDQNVKIEACSLEVDGVCKFSCPEGMEVSGPESITCRPDRVWTDIPPICVPITCSKQNETTRMQINWDRCLSTAGTNCSFSCDDGWEMIGPSTISCGNDGQWNADAPSCMEITCPPLTVIDGGNTTCPATQQSPCSFECKEGYELKGPSQIDCKKDGTWSVEPPTCKEPVCSALSDPDNGVVNCYGTTCVYTCDSSYYLNGASSLTCRPGGIWSGEPATCIQNEPMCQMPEAPANGNIGSCETNVGGRCSITCNNPNFPLGNNNLECKIGAQWSDVPAICVPASMIPRYIVGPTPMNAEDAIEWCKSNSGGPLQIWSEAQNTQIVNILKEEHPEKMVWLGTNDKETEGTWVWSNGKAIEYSNWMSPHPLSDSLDEEIDCSAIWNRQEYKWVSACCDEKLYPMCKYVAQLG